MLNFSVIFLTLLLIPLIIIVCYYFIYKRNINKKLQEYNSGKESTSGRLPGLGSIAVVLVIIVGFFWLASIDDGLNTVNHQVQMLMNSVDQKFNDNNKAYNELYAELRKANSLITSVNFSFGKYYEEEHEAELIVSMVPKEISRDTEVSVKIFGQNHVLQSDSFGGFEGKVRVDVFKSFYDENITYAITTGDIIKTGEILVNDYQENLDELWRNYLLNLEVNNFSEGIEYENNKLHVEVDGELWVWRGEHSEDELEELKILVTVGEKEIEEYTLYDKRSNEASHIKESYEYKINNSYDYSEHEELLVCVVAKDKYGYTYKCPIIGYMDNAIEGFAGCGQILDDNNNDLGSF